MSAFGPEDEELESPMWEQAERVHDWRNYVTENIMKLWPSFSLIQKRAIHECLQSVADSEEWE